MTDVVAELRKAASNGRLVRVERPGAESSYGHGVPLELSDELVVLRQYDPGWLQFNGFVCYRVADIHDVRSDENERFHEAILRREGGAADFPAPRVSADGIVELLECLQQDQELLILECESLPEEEFWVGEIADVDEAAVQLHVLDALGEWEPALATVALADVTAVRWAERYIQMYRKYATRPSPR